MTDHSDNESVTDSAVTSKVGIGEVSAEKRGGVDPELVEGGETGRGLLSLAEGTRGLVGAGRTSGRACERIVSFLESLREAQVAVTHPRGGASG